MLTKEIINLHVRSAERRQSGDVASVQDQCVRQGRGHGQEADAFLHTTVMTSLAYREVIRWNWKGKISELGRHLTVMLYRRMHGRLIGGRHSWKQRRIECF